MTQEAKKRITFITKLIRLPQTAYGDPTAESKAELRETLDRIKQESYDKKG